MSNDPFAEQPGDPPPQWGQDQTPSPPPGGAPSVGAASVGKRVGAWIVDGIGLGIIILIVLAILGLRPGSYLYNILQAVAAIAYFAVLEGSSGQTIAKRLFGIKAVSADGSPLTMQAALLRRLPFYIGAVIPFLGFLVAFGLLLAILITTIQDEPEHRGLHDKWAGTRVIDA
jgi:uncharacterized RDD family membrane protein YckC